MSIFTAIIISILGIAAIFAISSIRGIREALEIHRIRPIAIGIAILFGIVSGIAIDRIISIPGAHAFNVHGPLGSAPAAFAGALQGEPGVGFEFAAQEFEKFARLEHLDHFAGFAQHPDAA